MTLLKSKALILLDGFLNAEYKHKRAIIDLYDDIGDIFENPSIATCYLDKYKCGITSNALVSAIKNNFADELIDNYKSLGIKVITEFDGEYPSRLKDLPFNPICLYALGNVSLLNAKNTFSVVGSRKTLIEYLKLTEDIVSSLSKSNVTIVTGVAGGGDTTVIKSAVEFKNVICVLACGFNFIKGEVNYDLINKVIQNGLLISEYPPDIPPQSYRYPIRNRIIAGLGDGTLIISGNYKSGTRHTANYALDYGKDLFCFPYQPNVDSGALCNGLIKDGAILTTCVQDIAEVLHFENSKNNAVSLSDVEKSVYAVIKNGISKIDDIVEELSIKIFVLMPILSSLEIKGVIVKSGTNEYLPLK